MPDALPESARFCSRCGQPVVVAEASFCKDCGAPLAAPTGPIAGATGWKPIIAAALSIVPGLGHLYRGHALRAVLWFVAVSVAYTAPPLGFILHLVCAANAAWGGMNSERAWTRSSGARSSRRWSEPKAPVSPYRGAD